MPRGRPRKLTDEQEYALLGWYTAGGYEEEIAAGFGLKSVKAVKQIALRQNPDAETLRALGKQGVAETRRQDAEVRRVNEGKCMSAERARELFGQHGDSPSPFMRLWRSHLQRMTLRRVSEAEAEEQLDKLALFLLSDDDPKTGEPRGLGHYLAAAKGAYWKARRESQKTRAARHAWERTRAADLDDGNRQAPRRDPEDF